MSPRTVRVTAQRQVVEFVSRQAPEPRRRIRMALRGLTHERGDIKALEGIFSGYHRLRVGAFRVIFAYARDGAGTQCIFAERRNVVYVMLERMLQERMAE